MSVRTFLYGRRPPPTHGSQRADRARVQLLCDRPPEDNEPDSGSEGEASKARDGVNQQSQKRDDDRRDYAHA